jgi:Peptidase family C25/Propeptide_C25/FlgD Ig-like domain
MKRSFLFIVLLITICQLSAVWNEIPENTGKELFDHTSFGKEITEIEFSLDGYQMEEITENGQLYHKISYLNAGEYVQIGKPDLPCFTRLVTIPDQGIPSLEIVSYEEEIISNIMVYPRQELISESQANRMAFTIDDDYYSTGEVFPAVIGEVGPPAILRGIRVVNVTINPFRYDPVTRELSILKNVDVVVNTSGSGGENTIRQNRKLSKAFEPLYKSTILNYESTLDRDEIYQDPSYLFIYPNVTNVLTNLEYLSDWKHQKGFNVTLASTTETGSSTTAIKNYIQNAYDNWEDPPEFVCLVGDVGGTFNIPTYFITYYSAEGDHPYAQLDGNDVLEDVFLGRISISSISDLQTYIAKVLYYEKEPFMDETDWYNTSLMVGDPSHSGPSTIYTKQAIVEMMQQHAPNIDATEVYSGSYSSLMSSNLSSGVSYFNYRGWLGMSTFDNTDINNLNNYKKLPFAVFLTCGTGSFGSGTSRSEAFIRTGSVTNPTGAIAAIGTATSGTHTNFNNCVDAGIYYGIFADDIYNPGGAVNRGKIALYEHYPQNPGGHVDNFTHMNSLMGDPGVELWTGIPQDLVANYESQISLGTNYLEVTVNDDLGNSLESAWVTALMGEDDIFVTGFTNEDGFIALEINANVQGSVNLTVTKHDYIPHLGSFDVGEIDRSVNVMEYVIDDDNIGDSSGNDDGIINPGETIELTLSLKNYGTMTVNGVEAVISTEDDFITITDNLETYGNIAAGASTFCIEDYDFSVIASVLGGTEIRLDVAIEDDLGNTWHDIIYLVVEGANLDAIDCSIIDPNGYLDPGETAEMAVTLQNNGLVTADAIYGNLYSLDSRVTVSDAEGYFGTITGEGGQSSNTSDTFEVTANTQLITGTQVLMEIDLYNADGYDSTIQFMLGIGEVFITDPVGPDAYGYFCYDDGDINYLSVPVYDWIEINNIGTNLNLNDPGDTGDIETIIDLPISFRMYGEEYNSLTVCSNGWIAPGGSTQASFMNSPIPGPQGPSPMIAPFWDDLKIANGDVYWHYDSSLHIIIVEWDHLQNDEDSNEETFQVILYDSNYYPTTTGDSEIKFQYKVINNTSAGSYPNQHGQYATVGIEDPTGTIGLEYTFNNSYPDAAKHLQNEMALKLTGPSIPLETPFLVLGGITIIDSNGNGQADFGEDISLDILLNNMGENPATNVSATISSTDLHITINQDTSAYGNIQGSGSANSQNDFEISVAEDCPDGHNVNFEINITSNEDTWIIYFSLGLNAPNINFSSIYIEDGDDGILDPGETADIYVSFLNEGGSDSYNTVTEIITSDPYTTINSSTHNFGVFNAGSTMTALYNVSMSTSASVGHVASVTANISADTNYFNSTEFVLQIGFAYTNEGFESGDFESLDWEMGGSANWIISTDAIEGTYSAQSGDINDNQTSELSVTLDILDDGEISFYRKVSSENNWDSLEFYINGALQEEWSGTVDWAQATFPVQAGSRTFKWSYDKDGSVSTGNDCAWIDDIIFPASGGIANMGFVIGNIDLVGGSGNIEDVAVGTGINLTHPDVNGDYVLPLPAGTYDLTAELDGYSTDYEDNVNIIVGQTITVDFTLSALEIPEFLVATVSTNDVTLAWEMPTDSVERASRSTTRKSLPAKRNLQTQKNIEEPQTDTTRSLTGFKVYRDNVVIEEITNTATMTYVDEFLNAGEYSYFVTAVYDDVQESAPSNTEEATVTLAAPSDLQAVVVTPNIELNWTAPTGTRSLTGYTVYRNNQQIIQVTETTYTDEDLENGVYAYYVKALYGSYESDASNEVIIELTDANNIIIPENTALLGNYPNPFNPTTEISFALKDAQKVNLEIFNVRGQKVITLVTNSMDAGLHQIVWEGLDDAGKQISSGIYFYKMKAGEYNATRKMIMMK